MKRIFLAALFQLLAVAAIIVSLQPCLALFLGENRGPYHYYEHIYWNYLAIRSWLVVLAGIASGAVLFWIGTRIKSKETALQKTTGLLRFSIKRIAAIFCLVVGAILAFVFLPGLSGIFGRNILNYHTPMEVSPRPADGMAFMIMSNDLTTPRIELHPPDSGIKPLQLMLNTNAPGGR